MSMVSSGGQPDREGEKLSSRARPEKHLAIPAYLILFGDWPRLPNALAAWIL